MCPDGIKHAFPIQDIPGSMVWHLDKCTLGSWPKLILVLVNQIACRYVTYICSQGKHICNYAQRVYYAPLDDPRKSWYPVRKFTSPRHVPFSIMDGPCNDNDLRIITNFMKNSRKFAKLGAQVVHFGESLDIKTASPRSSSLGWRFLFWKR